MQRSYKAATLVLLGAAAARAELIRPGDDSIILQAGAQFSFPYFLDDSSTLLFGYSLDLDVAPQAGATGAIAGDAAASDFFDERNLFTAAGLQRDPFFSTILATSDGLFISTNSADGSTTTAVPNVNDALARLVFTVSPDALGDFTITLGPASVLVDAEGRDVPFEAGEVRVTVIPAPAAALVLLAACSRSHRRRRNSRA